MQRSEDDGTMSVEKLKSNVMARIKDEKRWGNEILKIGARKQMAI